MMVLVNGVEALKGRPVQNWGELLALLDEQCEADGVVVTDVAFDGVAEPSFRDAGMVLRQVQSSRIEVDTARRSDLLLSAIGDALRAMEPLHASAAALAVSFREHDIERANRDLADFARNVGSLLELTGAIATVTGLDLATTRVPGKPGVALGEVSALVETLIATRNAGDWISLADLLEYDVTGTLDQWRSLLAAVHRDVLAACSPT